MNRKAFTLIELLIVVVLVAIVTAIALPAYQENVRKARRAEAKASVTAATMAMERYYMAGSPSTYVGASLGSGSGDIYPSQAPLDGNKKFYNLSLSNLAATTYTVTATPINGQQADRCGSLTINQLGVLGVSGQSSGVTWQDCWE